MVSTAETTIGTVRVRGFRESATADRLALSRLVGSADLQPSGLPPSAVLIVRRISDPAPGRIAPHRRSARVDPIWERAATDALTTLYRRAERPAQGYVPAGADAVLFADEGEMLACLILDLCSHQVDERWWWHSIVRTLPALSQGGLSALLRRRAVIVPAALQYLAERGRLLTLAAALTPAEAVGVLVALARVFSLPDLRPLLHSVPEEQKRIESAAWPPPPPEQPQPGNGPAPPGTAPFPAAPPWERWLPSSRVPAVLAREQACLLGVGLGLYHAPAVVGDRAFLSALRAWWTAPAPGTAASPPVSHGGVQVEAPGRPFVRPADAGEHVSETAGALLRDPLLQESPLTRATAEEMSSSPEVVAPGSGTPAGAIGHSESETGAGGVASSRQDGGAAPAPPTPAPQSLATAPDARDARHPVPLHTDAAREDARSRGDRILDSTPVHSADPTAGAEHQFKPVEDAPLALANGVHTRLGGVLYLINVLCRLDLPACFEEEWGLETAVGPWEVLEAMGRALLERNAEELRADPLWAALAHLGGRSPGELPGSACLDGSSFRLPPSWHAHPGGDERNGYFWAVAAGRLRLWSSRGYLLLDSAADPAVAPTAQAAGALRAHGGGDPRRRAFRSAPLAAPGGPLIADMNAHMVRWLSLMLPFIRVYLRRALRLRSGDDLEGALLCRPATLYVTSTHVDLVMRMDDISVPVRICGLDRDPGWLPDFSRVIKFHFA